uniref:G domain-containing protein n=1 Tax=Magallana gigas TaxID=29159 RepID=K1QAH7_MAGGI
MKDLQKHDCGIVVAGETSAGKSALINKLIGHETLAEGVLETTAKIYRVKHSAKIGANGNVTIVDTPGIGDSIALKKMLEEYIPKAVAFIIVMDVSRAGGLQRDRTTSMLSPADKSEYHSQFKQFEEAIYLLIKKKENIRIQTHGRYLSCVVLEASKVLSEALTANQKEIDGNDITLQNFKEIMTKTMEAIKTRSESSIHKKRVRINNHSPRLVTGYQAMSYALLPMIAVLPTIDGY